MKEDQILFLVAADTQAQKTAIRGPFSVDGRVLVPDDRYVSMTGGPENAVSVSEAGSGIFRLLDRQGTLPDVFRQAGLTIVNERFMNIVDTMCVGEEIRAVPMMLVADDGSKVHGYSWLYVTDPRKLPIALPAPDFFVADTFAWFASKRLVDACNEKGIRGLLFTRI